MTPRPSHNRLTYWLVFIILVCGAELRGQWTDGTNIIYTTAPADKVGIGATLPDDLLHLKVESGDAIFKIENTGDGNYSTLEFSRERLSGENVTGGVIYLRSDASTNSPTLHFDVNTSTSSGASNGAHLQIERNQFATDEINMLNVNVGIGTDSPAGKLDVYGNVYFRRSTNPSNKFLYIHQDSVQNKVRSYGSHLYLETRNNTENIVFATDNTIVERMRIDMGTGNVGIGTANPQSLLAVNGKITAKEVEVISTGWPDFVFDEGYDLMPLADVDAYITENGHLPDVPSAIEVAVNGVALGESQALLLRKIEELTLYMIDLKQENDELQQRMGAIDGVIKQN